MRNEGSKDTIAAIATPPGEGGIAIVRISGARAGEILRAAFRPAHKGEMKHGQMRYGTLTDQAGAPIDEVMAVLFRAPRSYTREDVAEIHLHGGTMCARAAMERLLSLGARAAEPGEFTYRAFMNGRVDLSEAEAIMGLIGARSQAARRASVRQLRGGVSAPIGRMREELTGLLAKIEAATDFPDEIDEDVTARDVLEGAARIREELARAADGHRARIVREGASVVLCGRPNVGKSSLMNALLSADRAIVTDIPGTTRDVLTESFEIGGVRYQLSDTAGIRETADAIEKIGVDRARDALRDADCVLLVLDASVPLSPADQAMLAARDERYVTILNKCDLLPAQESAPPSPATCANAEPAIPAVENPGIPAATRANAEPAIPAVENPGIPAVTCANAECAVSAVENLGISAATSANAEVAVSAVENPGISAAPCANAELAVPAVENPGISAVTCATAEPAVPAVENPGSSAATRANAEPAIPAVENPGIPAAPWAQADPAAPCAKVDPAAPCAKVDPAAPCAEVDPAAPWAKADPAAPFTNAEPTVPAGRDTGTVAESFTNATPCAKAECTVPADRDTGMVAASFTNATPCANAECAVPADRDTGTVAASFTNAAPCAKAELTIPAFENSGTPAAPCAKAERAVPTDRDTGTVAESFTNAASCANAEPAVPTVKDTGTAAPLPTNAVLHANASFVLPVSSAKDTGTAAPSIPHATIYTSARTGAGVDEILRAIERVCRQTGASEEQMILPRHIECAHNAMQALDRAIQAIQTNQPLDLSATDLREALAHLGDITGETMNEHVIDRVFSDFCVGK